MTRELVARYLAQTRLARDPEAIASAITQSYDDNFRHLCDRLRLTEADRPELFVAYTANAKVETLSLQGSGVIVYDQYLGQSFNRLNDFALCEWPAAYVLRWGFKHLGVALASIGQISMAHVALACADFWEASGRPRDRSAEMLPARSLVTAIQEYFVLAHELSHVRVGQEAELPWQLGFDDLLDRVVELLQEQTVDQAEVDEQMLQDELRALQASLGSPPPHESFIEELREARQDQILEAPDPSDVLNERSSLREEVLCDHIATELTLERFVALGAPPPTVLASILHGLHNLASLTVIRDHARDVSDRPEAESELPGMVVRKSIWRTLVREIHGTLKSDPEVHARLTEITELHARTVGDQFIFILPFEFGRVLNAIDGGDRSDLIKDLTLDSIREFVDVQRRGPLTLPSSMREVDNPS